MTNKHEERLKEIIKMADKLKWIYPTSSLKGASYPPMQLSEVEKCMLAMVDDFELKRMREWTKKASESAEAKGGAAGASGDAQRNTKTQPAEAPANPAPAITFCASGENKKLYEKHNAPEKPCERCKHMHKKKGEKFFREGFCYYLNQLDFCSCKKKEG